MLCPRPYTVDPVTCSCVCPPAVTSQCLPPRVLDEVNCRCSGQILTPNTGQCELGCIWPLVLHPTECRCICPSSISRICPNFQFFNERTCRCENRQIDLPPSPLLTPPDLAPPIAQCLLLCRPPKVLSSSECKCICPERESILCRFPLVWDEETC